MSKKKYSTINLFIRSLLFSIYSLTTIFIFSFFCLFSFILPLHSRFIFIRAYLRVYFYVLKKLCHIDYHVEGLEHLQNIKNGVVLSKHQSTWEAFFLPLIFHDSAFIAKHELLWLPFFGWGLASSEPIIINRSKTTSAMQQIIEKGRRFLQQGRWVVIFPEGTRVAYGKIGHYRLGGARLAAITGYPVIPVAHNAGLHWPRRKFIKKPGTIRVVIGPPIESKGKTPEEILALAKLFIETTMTRIQGFVDKSSS